MKTAYKYFNEVLDGIKESGTYKNERVITTEQRAIIDTSEVKGVHVVV